MKWMTLILLLLPVSLGLLAGCDNQPKVSKMFPVALPLESPPATSVTVVGEGSTAEEARQSAMLRLVRQVLLPGGAEEMPTFVESMVRGYNVVSTEQDLRGRYYVTIELTMVQLAINYQELYAVCQEHQSELDELKGRPVPVEVTPNAPAR